MSVTMTDDLESLPGVGPATADKLRENGYDNFESIAVSSPTELSSTADLGESTAIKIINEARELSDVGKFETGTALLQKRAKVNKISTGSESFDELLGGGIETHSITEVYGEFGSAKTQIAHQIAVNAQLADGDDEATGSVIYVDTENSFRPERLKSMAEDTPLDPEEALENVHVARAYNSDHQMLLVEKAHDLAKQLRDTKPVRLLVVDSLTSHFRAEYVGRGSLAERQQKLNRHMHDIIKFADMYRAAALVTNQVQSKPDAFFGDPTRPIGGNITGHNATFRIYLRKSKGQKRIARLVDSPSHPEGEAVFKVTNEGIQDA